MKKPLIIEKINNTLNTKKSDKIYVTTGDGRSQPESVDVNTQKSDSTLENATQKLSILAKLKNALDAKESGTIYVSTDDGHAGIISYQAGILTGAITGRLRGAEALRFLVFAERSNYRLHQRSMTLPDSQPATAEVQQILALASVVGDSRVNVQNETKTAIDPVLQAQAFAIIAKHLAESAGPNAAFLVDEVEKSFVAASNDPQEFESALQVLMREISDSDQSQQFLQRSRAELEALLEKHKTSCTPTSRVAVESDDAEVVESDWSIPRYMARFHS
jgi:hypothetical protein